MSNKNIRNSKKKKEDENKKKPSLAKTIQGMAKAAVSGVKSFQEAVETAAYDSKVANGTAKTTVKSSGTTVKKPESPAIDFNFFKSAKTDDAVSRVTGGARPAFDFYTPTQVDDNLFHTRANFNAAGQDLLNISNALPGIAKAMDANMYKPGGSAALKGIDAPNQLRYWQNIGPTAKKYLQDAQQALGYTDEQMNQLMQAYDETYGLTSDYGNMVRARTGDRSVVRGMPLSPETMKLEGLANLYDFDQAPGKLAAELPAGSVLRREGVNTYQDLYDRQVVTSRENLKDSLDTINRVLSVKYGNMFGDMELQPAEQAALDDAAEIVRNATGIDYSALTRDGYWAGDWYDAALAAYDEGSKAVENTAAEGYIDYGRALSADEQRKEQAAMKGKSLDEQAAELAAEAEQKGYTDQSEYVPSTANWRGVDYNDIALGVANYIPGQEEKEIDWDTYRDTVKYSFLNDYIAAAAEGNTQMLAEMDAISGNIPEVVGYNLHALPYMSDEQRKTFYAYFNNGDYKAIDEFMGKINYDIAKRFMESWEEEYAQSLEGDVGAQIGGTIASFGSNLLANAAGLANTGNQLLQRMGILPDDGYSHEYNPSYMYQTQSDLARGTMGQTIEDATPWATIGGINIAKAAFQGISSVADSVAASAIGGPIGGLVLLSGGASGRELQEQMEAGNPNADIYAVGSGLIEAAFEKVGLDALFSGKVTKALFGNAAEEAGTELANMLWDVMINGDNSQTQKLLDQYKIMGYTDKAEFATALVQAKQVLEAGISGMFGGTASIPSAIASNVADKKQGAAVVENEGVGKLLDIAETVELPEDVKKLLGKVRTGFNAIQDAANAAEPANIDVKAVADKVKSAFGNLKGSRAEVDAAIEKGVQAAKDVLSEVGADIEAAIEKGKEAVREAMAESTQAEAETDVKTVEDAVENSLREAISEQQTTSEPGGKKNKSPKISNAAIGRIFRETMAKLDERAKAVLSENFSGEVAARLQGRGFKGDVQQMAQIVSDFIGGIKNTPEALRAIASSDIALELVNDLTAPLDAIRELEGFAQKKPKTESDAKTSEAAQETNNVELPEVEDEFDAVVAEVQGREILASEGETSTLDGEEIEILGIEAAGGAESGGAPKVRVRTAEGVEKTVDAESIAYNANDTGAYELAAYAGKYGRQADQMYDNIRPGQDVVEYARAFDKAVKYGSDGKNVDVLKKSGAVSALNDQQLTIAYEIGRTMRAARSQEQQMRRSSKGAMVPVGNVDTSAIPAEIRRKLSPHQKKAIGAMSRLAKPLGINVRFVQSRTNAEGKYIDDNGTWNADTRTLTLDINAGKLSSRSARNLMMDTAGHELTHYIKQFADSNLWDEYQDFVMGHLDAKLDLEKEIERYMAHDSTLSRDDAIEEIIAQASVKALSRISDQQLADLAESNPTLFGKIKKFLSKWIKNMKKAIREAFDSGEGESNFISRAMEDQLDEMAAKWNTMLGVASKNAHESRSVVPGVEINTESQTATVKNSRQYDGGHAKLPVAQDVVDDFVKQYKAKGDVKFSRRMLDDGTQYTLVDATEINAEGIVDGDSIGKKARIYMRNKYRGIVLPVGETKAAYIRNDGINEYTNPRKFLTEEGYQSKMVAATELDNILKASSYLRWGKDDGHHPEAVRGWTYWRTIFAVKDVESEALKVFQGDIQIMRIARGDVFHDITQIKEITNDNIGQSIVMDAKFVGDNEIVPRPEESVKPDTRSQMRDPYNASDRELLADALESLAANADELDILRRYQKRVQNLDAKQQQLQEVEDQLRALKQGDAKANRDEIIKLTNNAKTIGSQISRMGKELLNLEAMAPIKKLADREREAYKQELKAKTDEQIRRYKERLKMDTEDKIREVREREAEKRRKLREQGDDRLRKAVQEQREVGQRKVDRLKESQGREKYRAMILKEAKRLHDWVSHPTNKGHVPDFLRKPLADFLESIDFSSKRVLEGGDPTLNDRKFADALEALRYAVSDIQKQQTDTDSSAKQFRGYIDLPANFVQEFDELVRKIKITLEAGKQINDTPFNRMTAAQLQEMNNFFKILNHSIVKMNQLTENGRYNSAKNASSDTVEDMNAMAAKVKTNKVLAGLNSIFNWKNTTPYYAFQRLGRGGKAIFEGLQNGWDKMAENSAKLIAYAEDTFTAKQARVWSKDIRTIKLDSGESIQITAAQAMSLYCLNKRAQAIGHLMGGGIRISDIDAGRGNTISQVDNYILSAEDVNRITGTLSAEQRTVADKLQRFMNTTCTDWGNEISMKRFGYKMFTEDYYFPIETDANNRSRIDDKRDGNNSMFRLLNMSAMKPLTEKANNAIIIRDIFDVFSNHAADIGKYNALALPILDFIKWYNHVEKTEVVDKDGKPTGQFTTRSTQKALERAYGSDAREYLMNFIKDLNAEHDGGRNDSILTKMMGNAKAGSVSANIRVAFLQITSLPRAAYAISPKYLAGGMMKLRSLNPASAIRGTEAQEKIGILKWKNLGFYSTDVARSTRGMVRRDDNVIAKVRDIIMKPAEWGDNWVSNIIYEAVKLEMKAKHPGVKEGTNVYNTMVNNRVREIVYKTQVVDSTMTRSDFMRSKGLMTAFTAFMSEPTLTVNMLNEAVQEAVMQKRTGAAAREILKANGGKALRALATFAFTACASTLVESIFDALRDDDDYEEFMEKLLAAAKGNAVENVNILSMLPFIKDVISIAQGYENSSMVTQVWDQMMDAKKAIEGYQKGTRPLYNVIYNALKVVGSASGVGVQNAARDGIGIYNTVFADAMNMPKIQTYENTKAEGATAYYNAVVSGDTEKADWILHRAEINGLTKESFADKIVTLVQDDYLAGKLDADSAIDTLVEHAGKKKEQAAETVGKWQYGAATGMKYSNLKQDYLDGKISEADVRRYSAEVEGLNEEKIEDRISSYNYTKYTGKTTTAPKYWELAYTHDSGGDYKDYADRLLDEIMATGRSYKQARASIASSLESYYKKDYLAIKGTPEGDRMLEEILDVYEAIGFPRSYERDYINKNWEEDE